MAIRRHDSLSRVVRVVRVRVARRTGTAGDDPHTPMVYVSVGRSVDRSSRGVGAVCRALPRASAHSRFVDNHTARGAYGDAATATRDDARRRRRRRDDDDDDDDGGGGANDRESVGVDDDARADDDDDDDGATRARAMVWFGTRTRHRAGDGGRASHRGRDRRAA